MKILVTGETGFIGAAVARKLSQQGHEVVALSRSVAAAAKLQAAGLTPVAGDFADPASLAEPAAQVDAVVSTASIGQVEGSPDSFAKDRDAVTVMTTGCAQSCLCSNVFVSGEREDPPPPRPMQPEEPLLPL